MRVVPAENPSPKTYAEASIQVLANGDAAFGKAHFPWSGGHLKDQLAQGNRMVISHDSFVLNAEDGIEVITPDKSLITIIGIYFLDESPVNQ